MQPRAGDGGHGLASSATPHMANVPELTSVPDGSVRRALAAVDWTGTAVGPPEEWPTELTVVVRTMLSSRFAMWMAWGPELTFFCNDKYVSDTLSAKFPWALGRPAREVWSEIWPDIGPRIESVLESGTSTWDERLLLFLERSGYREETYHTFSYSPLQDGEGEVAGMLCVVSEETERVIAERRLRTLRNLAGGLAGVNTEAAVCDVARDQLAQNRFDLPFSLIYLYDSGGQAHRACAAGIGTGHAAAPATISSADASTSWPLPADGHPLVVERLGDRFGPLPHGALDAPPERALVVPLTSRGDGAAAGFAVAALNAFRPLDEDYVAFVELLGGQLSAALTSAREYAREQERARALAELDRAKSDFFSNVSHELRTPLTLIAAPAEDALADVEQPLADAQRERVEMIRRNARRLTRMVSDLLDFARLERGQMEAAPVQIDLTAFTRELVASFAPAIERAGLELRVQLAQLPGPVMADPEMWEKIVLNLLSNALKFTPSGYIAVTLRAVEGAVQLEVADSGVGISDENLPHLFERFYRVHGSGGRSHEGSGIGLALVSEAVALHGGSLDVSSELGAGSRFQVRIPVTDVAAPPVDEGAEATPSSAYLDELISWTGDHDMATATEVAQPSLVPAGSGGTVLVVDDNADVRALLTRLLTPHLEVLAASDGQQALEMIRDRIPDLILTDVMMPHLDGFGLLRELRADPRTASLPVIMLSARAGEEAAIGGLEAGVDEYLVKPFSPRELIARVRSVLQLATLRRQREHLQAAHTDILELIAQGEPLPRTLELLALLGEQSLGGDAAVSILLRSEDGAHLRHGAAPSLPADYNAAIDGLTIGEANGSCGTAAFQGRSVVVSDTSSDPLWRDFRELAARHELRACWAVPVKASDGEVVGTFAIYHRQRHVPTPAEQQLAALMCQTTAVAIERDGTARAREAQFNALQRSLLPRALPRVPGVEVASAFRPGSRGLEVGGDFYDVFELGDGSYGFVIGDVCGHGAEAAAQTALARHTTRAAARREPDPARVLEAVDDALRHSDLSRYCTAVYGRFEVAADGVHMWMASGGHPPPLLLRQNSAVEVLGTHGPLLGILEPPLKIPTVHVILSPGDLLLTYTDGLIERNPFLPSDAMLRSALSHCAGRSADGVVAAIEALTPDRDRRDDVAILALRARA